jgi:hypothetical protein
LVMYSVYDHPLPRRKKHAESKSLPNAGLPSAVLS